MLQEIALKSALQRKLSAFMRFAEGDMERLARLEDATQTFPSSFEMIGQGDRFEWVYVVRSGWGMRFKLLADGERQIINFVLPGDLVCFDAVVFEYSESSVCTLTELTAARFEPHHLLELSLSSPRLALALAWCNAKDEQALIERIVSLGRRTAYERMAHLFTELWRRLHLLGLTQDNRFEMPLTQSDIADTLGISLVHVNRVVQRLRRDRLIEIEHKSNKRIVQIRDLDGLQRAASFEGGYLHYTEVPARIEAMLKARETARHGFPMHR